MILEDIAIKYAAKLKEVQNNLEKLKTLEMNSTFFEAKNPRNKTTWLS